MPESTEPISTAVSESVTVDTGADKESITSINDAFADFWKDEDAKTPETPTEAPAAPGEGAAQETRVAAPEVKPSEAKPAETKPPETKLAAGELSDDEIDRMQLPLTARPEHIADFSKMREQVKLARTQLRTQSAEHARMEEQLAQARQNAWTPEQKADYEHAAQVRRRFDFVSDPEFLQKFHMPVQQRFESVLEEAVEALPDRQAARQWADFIKANYHPDQLDREWWLNKVVAQVPNEMERAALLNSITQMRQMQRERDTEIQRRTNDKSSFDNWINEKVQFTSKRVQEEIMSEIGTQEQRIKEILPRDVTQAKTTEERQAIEAHNERFNRLNEKFRGFMQDISANGPRAWVRASVEATRALILEEEYNQMANELKSIKGERDQYKAELDKITGARRKLANTSGTPPATAGKKDGNLSIKNLDVRQAFDKYDWGDST
jgi:hypothetical protein